MWESIVQGIAGAFLNTFGKALTDMFHQWFDAREAEARGHAEADARANQAASEVEQRMGDAASQLHDADTVADQLQRGEL